MAHWATGEKRAAARNTARTDCGLLKVQRGKAQLQVVASDSIAISGDVEVVAWEVEVVAWEDLVGGCKKAPTAELASLQTEKRQPGIAGV